MRLLHKLLVLALLLTMQVALAQEKVIDPSSGKKNSVTDVGTEIFTHRPKPHTRLTAQISYPGNDPGIAIVKTLPPDQIVLENNAIRIVFINKGENNN